MVDPLARVTMKTAAKCDM